MYELSLVQRLVDTHRGMHGRLFGLYIQHVEWKSWMQPTEVGFYSFVGQRFSHGRVVQVSMMFDVCNFLAYPNI